MIVEFLPGRPGRHDDAVSQLAQGAAMISMHATCADCAARKSNSSRPHLNVGPLRRFESNEWADVGRRTLSMVLKLK